MKEGEQKKSGEILCGFVWECGIEVLSIVVDVSGIDLIQGVISLFCG